LVIGAGPSGCAVACALVALGREVRVWERAAASPSRKVGETLPAAARPLLRDLGLGALWEAPYHLPSPGARVRWESEEVRLVDAIRDPQGASLHLDRPRFEADLWSALSDRGIPRDGFPFRSARFDGERWEAEAHGGQRCRPRFLIDATGRSHAVARSLGSSRRSDPSLVAVIEWRERLPEDQDRRTSIEAVEEGWWYSAPLTGPSGEERVFVFHTEPQLASALLRDDLAWERVLARSQLLSPLAGGGVVANRCTRGAAGAVVTPAGGPGWLAVGDAAMSFEPLSSQGLFHALYSGLRGGQAVHAALDGVPEPGIAYGRTLREVRRRYLAHQRAFLSAVRRFPKSPFWTARQS
jgi:2-polyprenyl-6-methoxyphenol hydroxylase-like FAD-dependent oxidoreductase